MKKSNLRTILCDGPFCKQKDISVVKLKKFIVLKKDQETTTLFMSMHYYETVISIFRFMKNAVSTIQLKEKITKTT